MEHRNWDFESGNLVLDFANTAEFHASEQPLEYLQTYSDLVTWSQEAGLLTRSEAKESSLLEQKKPQVAARVLTRALTLRETIYSLLSTVARQESLNEAELTRFNRFLAESLRNTKISPTSEGYSWTWESGVPSIDRVLWTLTREAANLITSKELKRVGECADDRGCGYLFIDTSRNHSRRWCSMEGCGNRAKAQRHYQKISKK
jgi:predicted RNA-binding Zn ribbon-like protein